MGTFKEEMKTQCEWNLAVKKEAGGKEEGDRSFYELKDQTYMWLAGFEI